MRISDTILIKPHNLMEIETKQKYQWIKGDHFGEIETVSNAEDPTKIFFESGRAVMKAVADEHIKLIENEEDIVIIQKKGLENQIPEDIRSNAVQDSIPTKDPMKNSLTISQKKIGTAIENSRKDITLDFKINMKFLDASLYDFLKDNQEDFDDIYKELLFEQLKSHVDETLNNFINNTYPKNNVNGREEQIESN